MDGAKTTENLTLDIGGMGREWTMRDSLTGW